MKNFFYLGLCRLFFWKRCSMLTYIHIYILIYIHPSLKISVLITPSIFKSCTLKFVILYYNVLKFTYLNLSCHYFRNFVFRTFINIFVSTTNINVIFILYNFLLSLFSLTINLLFIEIHFIHLIEIYVVYIYVYTYVIYVYMYIIIHRCIICIRFLSIYHFNIDVFFVFNIECIIIAHAKPCIYFLCTFPCF